MRIAVFGGTFDPVHRMHLVIAREVLGAAAADIVLVVPTGTSSYRGHDAVTAPHHRCAMVAAAIREEGRLHLCRVDVDRPGPTHTIDTMAHLRSRYGSEHQLFFVVGADNLPKIPTWHRGPELMRTTSFLAVSRVGYPLVDPGFPPGRLSVFDVPPERFSATAIRWKVAHGIPIDDLVPERVARYIAEHDLYRPATTVRGLTTRHGARSAAAVMAAEACAASGQDPSLDGAHPGPARSRAERGV